MIAYALIFIISLLYTGLHPVVLNIALSGLGDEAVQTRDIAGY